jgi:hypothetical protein
MMSNITVGNDTIPVRPDEVHEFVIETALVAKGYGVSKNVIELHKSRRASELVEGKHWVLSKRQTPGGEQNQIFWTKRGIIRLGFFIKSGRAKLFRDAAEDLVINATRAPKMLTYAESLQLAADEAKRVEKLQEAMGIIAPRHEFGSISQRNGQPRTRLVPAYFRSGLDANGETRQFVAMQSEFTGWGWMEVAS